nr:MAG TPA: hypothetical protein [Caudoviricetes sp.]
MDISRGYHLIPSHLCHYFFFSVCLYLVQTQIQIDPVHLPQYVG